jgi:uncharacterized membrane protein YdjX (TVP38/TMEM64 family)
METDNRVAPINEGSLPWIKLAILATILLATAIGYFSFRDKWTLENLADYESQLRQFQHEHPVLVYGVAFLLYVTVTGLSLPGAAGLTLVYAWYFSFVRALILVSFASTAGATVAFLLSRYLLRDTIQRRFGDRLSAVNTALDRDGPFYLFTLRLIPAVPFFVINVVMGLTGLSVLTYWWVSQLGMLPGTAVYAYAGSTVPNLRQLAENGASGILSLRLVLAFTVLGLFPLALKLLMRRISTSAN